MQATVLLLCILQNTFKGWAHDRNKTKALHEEIPLTAEEISTVQSAQLAFPVHPPLGLLLHTLASSCAAHTG